MILWYGFILVTQDIGLNAKRNLFTKLIPFPSTNQFFARKEQYKTELMERLFRQENMQYMVQDVHEALIDLFCYILLS